MECFDHFLPQDEVDAQIYSWTQSKSVDEETLLMFGQDGSGGKIAIWVRDDSLDITDQPIVFFGSEGENFVIATNLLDFFWLLLSGLGPIEIIDNKDRKTNYSEIYSNFASEFTNNLATQPEYLLKEVEKLNLEFEKHFLNFDN